MSRTSLEITRFFAASQVFFAVEFTFLRTGSLQTTNCGASHSLKGSASLTGEAEIGARQEFSGVVEVNQSTESRFEPQEIEALLARNFELDSNDVCLINWSRLQ